MFDGEAIAKTFTRYVVPGLIFVFLTVILPACFIEPHLFLGKEPGIGATQVVILSIFTGYVLDAARGYRWTLHWRTYNSARDKLSEELAVLQDKPAVNPDELLAVLFVRNEKLYDRIFVDRAEWVMVLETALSLWLSALFLTIVGLCLSIGTRTSGLPELLIAPVLVGISYLASRNGIARMRAHNSKVVEAIRSLSALDAPTPLPSLTSTPPTTTS